MMDYDLGYYGVFVRWVKCAIMIMLLVLYTDHPVGIVSEASIELCDSLQANLLYTALVRSKLEAASVVSNAHFFVSSRKNGKFLY